MFLKMNYGKKTPSVGTPSVYSHVTSRSTANLRSSRSIRSLKTPWYQKPILQDAIFLDIQRASLLIGIFSLVGTQFTINCLILLTFECDFLVAVDFHCYFCLFRSVLLCNGRPWIHSLRLLCVFISVCLCRK